jgi:hypothetical protein
MSDWDRNLVELITDLDASGFADRELSELVEDYGAAPVARVIADGIAAVTHATREEVLSVFPSVAELEHLPRDEAIRLAQLEPVPTGYRVVHETLDAQSDGTLIFRYAADDPAAVAEVRSRAGLV